MIRRWSVMVGTMALVPSVVPGCDRLYHGTMRKFGVEKRDILIDRVKDARKAQQEAQEEFKTALERVREVTEVDGGTLEKKYDQLNGALTSELTAVEGNVDSLIAELQTAIAEADAYLAEMEEARTSRRRADETDPIADPRA